MDFGMPFLLETPSLQECAALCRELQLSFVELNMNFPQCQLAALSASQLNRLRREYGIYFTIHLDEAFTVCDFNPAVRSAYLDTAKKNIRLAREIGAPLINLHLARGVSLTLPGRKVVLFEQYQQEYRAQLRTFRDLCEREIAGENLCIAVENTGGFLEYEKTALELLLESGCFGLTLDIGHSHAAGDVDLPFYEAHSSRLAHMHAHDACGPHNHLALGDGEIDLAGRLRFAQAAGARVVLETKTSQALRDSVQFLRGALVEFT